MPLSWRELWVNRGPAVKVIVPIKQVACLDDDFEVCGDGRGVDPAFIRWDLNEWDSFSLEAALQICEAASGGEVVAISVGGERSMSALSTCLAMGAHRAVRIWDDGLDRADAIAVAHVLAAAIGPEKPDLVLCGAQSSDHATAATGTALAALLGLPRVAVVNALRVDRESGTATVERELEGGLVELLRVPIPAVLTVQTGINRPRHPNLRAIKLAEEKPIEEVSLSDLRLAEVDSLIAQRTVALARPQQEGAEILEGNAQQVAGRIIAIIEGKLRDTG